ncbi:hypothetical protein OQA88_252 [Cercophora sp. LCS_1]
MPVPPELQVLCRRLVSTPVEDLPRICPVLVSHVLRCGGPLSAVPEPKAKDKTSEGPMLVHKLRTHITTLLSGRSASGRFTAVCLVKAVIDVGGWESLRASEPWIRGLISVIQKPDPLPSKELALITLTKIYTLVQGYPTLVREMATPTLASFATACLQLIKSPASGQPLKTPISFIDTVACTFSTLIPLFPTTLRPFSAQLTAALKRFVAPTLDDSLIVPQSLRENSRRVLVLLHYTAAKNGSSDEWAKGIRAVIKETHTTADQVFRAVQESWESSTGYSGQAVRLDGEPCSSNNSELPEWSGLSAGAERLVGLIEYLGSYLDAATKASVTIPLGELLDLTSRISLITLPSPDSPVNLNSAISKDEKNELWTALPDIHTAAIHLHSAIVDRLDANALTLSTDIIDQLVRISTSDRHLPTVREAAYKLLAPLLRLTGPTLPKLTVDSLTPLIQSCCADTLRPTIYNAPPPQDQQPNGTTKAKDQPSSNADAFFTAPATSSHAIPPPASHESAAYDLVPLLLSSLPQKYISPDTRALLDRTAILCNSKPAMLASCLHPYKDSRGRYYPSILPFLIRQFPHDQDVEVLRTNLMKSGRVGQATEQMWEDPREGIEALLEGKKDRVEDTEMVDEDAPAAVEQEGETKTVGSGGRWGAEEKMEVDHDEEEPVRKNAFFMTERTVVVGKVEEVPKPPLKRKASKVEEAKAKRVDTGKGVAVVAEVAVAKETVERDDGDDSGSESGESVQIDMTFDDDEEEDEEDDE